MWPGVLGRFAAGFALGVAGARTRIFGVPKTGVAIVQRTTTEVASVTADLDTRCGGLYASGSEVLPAGKADNEDAAAAAGGGPHDSRRAIRLASLRLPLAGSGSSR